MLPAGDDGAGLGTDEDAGLSMALVRSRRGPLPLVQNVVDVERPEDQSQRQDLVDHLNATARP